MKLLLANPRKRRAAPKARTAKRRKPIARHASPAHHAAPKRRSRRRLGSAVRHHTKGVRRRISRGARHARHSLKGLMPAGIHTLKMGVVAGLGAVGADLVAAQINKYLPVQMQTGVMQQVTQALVSVVAGMLINRVNKTAGQAIAMGGVTIATYNLAHSMLAGKGIPGIAEYDPLHPTSPGLLAYEQSYSPMNGLGSNEGLLEYETGLMAYENGAELV